MDVLVQLRVRKDYVRKSDGYGSVYLYIRIDKEKDQIPLGFHWPPELLDTSNNLLKSRQKADKLCQDYNLITGQAIARCNELLVEYRLKGREVTLKEFLHDYNQFEKRKDFLSYMEKKIEDRYRRKKISEGTKKSHVNTLIWLKLFKPVILFQDLNKKLIESFEGWLQRQHSRRDSHISEKPLDRNTISNILKFTKAYINLAIEDEIPITNPFGNADVKTTNDRKMVEFLLPDEVARLMDMYERDPLPIGEKLTLCRFLISCQLSLRISDVMALDTYKLNIYLQTRRLIFYPVKQQIQKKLKTVFLPIDDITFSYLQDCIDLQHAAEKEQLKVTEPYGRKVLKKLAHRAGITTGMGFHTARHTFATNFLRAGGKIHNLQQILGHTSLETTMIYVHIVEDDKDEEMLRLTEYYQQFRSSSPLSRNKKP
ncbi:site-specific integrase [Siphonobacter sp. SORGH_AS_0500]|uniref:tyrosine-type recombinase/integrase n=1 Tax=Siphonobacter sp. SORGH_AS_0500 TaxID=1864824 RepID=UPI0028664AAF|nr:site-specific integrase [Siphonobacter sp. SORGH_AS_0500]MDR6196135.1 site-specific recombinase XerD [Siphonobacter sp. SORGH_AS_0500]